LARRAGAEYDAELWRERAYILMEPYMVMVRAVVEPLIAKGRLTMADLNQITYEAPAGWAEAKRLARTRASV
jgi:hypothetical protein